MYIQYASDIMKQMTLGECAPSPDYVTLVVLTEWFALNRGYPHELLIHLQSASEGCHVVERITEQTAKSSKKKCLLEGAICKRGGFDLQ